MPDHGHERVRGLLPPIMPSTSLARRSPYKKPTKVLNFETHVLCHVPNPSDITLNESQSSVALALEFEKEESFLVRVDNFARSNRAILITGVTTQIWLELLPKFGLNFCQLRR